MVNLNQYLLIWKGMFVSTKKNSEQYFQRDKYHYRCRSMRGTFIEYIRSIKLIVKYFKGNIKSIKPNEKAKKSFYNVINQGCIEIMLLCDEYIQKRQQEVGESG